MGVTNYYNLGEGNFTSAVRQKGQYVSIRVRK